MKAIKLSEDVLRDLIDEVLNEDMGPGFGAPTKSKPPPLPPGANKPKQGPASAEIVKRFTSAVNMLADAGNKAQQAAGSHNIKEAERWLTKALDFAKSAQEVLAKGRAR